MLLMLTGCLYISDDEHEDRMDADGDGVDITEDCEPDDPSIGAYVWYADSDGDGYGDDGDVVAACEAPAETGWVSADEVLIDCDDNDASIYPGADEICDGVDNNCDAAVDDDDDAITDQTLWYADSDGDGYGDYETTATSCEAPAATGWLEAYDGALDCDDSDAAIKPGATELCDGIDNDCDEETSEDGTVTLNGADTYDNLQEAINDAGDVGDAVLVVCDGEWVDNYEIEADMSLLSLNGAEAAILDGDGDGSTVSILGAAVHIEGFTITGGSGTDIEGGRTGGGIFIGEDADVTLSDLIISGNSATRGGGVGVVEAAVEIAEVTFSENAGSGLGGGLFFEGSQALSILDSVFEANTGGSGGGLFLNEPNDASLAGLTFTGNTATSRGGGLGAERGAFTLEDSSLSGNQAAEGGGFSVFEMGELTFDDVSSDDNTATTNGGGGYIVNTTASLEGFSASENTANSGGGLYFSGSPERPLTLLESTISDNTADRSGGGITFEGGTATLQNVTISSNSSSTSCDLTFDELNISVGGGLSIQDGAHVAVSGSTTISLNDACVGGGVHVEDEGELTGEEAEPPPGGGGGEMPRVQISGNSAEAGGGFAVADTSGSSFGSLIELEFSANTAVIYGGGGIVIGELDAVGVAFTGNQAPQGGGIFIVGADLLGDEAFVSLVSCDITGNEATVDGGGGVHIYGDGVMESLGSNWGSEFEDNDPSDITLERLIGASEDYSGYGDNESFECSAGTLDFGCE